MIAIYGGTFVERLTVGQIFLNLSLNPGFAIRLDSVCEAKEMKGGLSVCDESGRRCFHLKCNIWDGRSECRLFHPA